MSTKQVPPSISETAFNCPHCGAYTTQYWLKAFAGNYGNDHRTPTIPHADLIEKVKADPSIPKEDKTSLVKWARRMALKKPFMEESKDAPYNPQRIENCNFSRCFNCKDIAIWVHDQLVYPETRINIEPNVDMPDQIKQLFEEAREIVNSSPKGAAALLRLSIQHLCIVLGEKGKNLDTDIASLVSKGLNPMVQKALDVVRVIGNESVHPGEIDLNDSRDIAVQLFNLVNLICDQMISLPKKVEALYASLPDSKRDGIDRRNETAKSKGGVVHPTNS